MPEKDRRTDNWGGYWDYNRDPNQYRFPRTSREAGFGDYYPQFQSFRTFRKKDDSKISWLVVIVFVALFLFLHNKGIF